MVARDPNEHGKQERFDRAASDPEPISGSESGTPRPDTNLGTSSLAGVDPDFGLDPHTEAPGYGGTDRGSTPMATPHQTRVMGDEGDHLAGGGGTGASVGGVARAGDTTSEADSYSNLAHGLGEAETGANMPQGATAPAAADQPTSSGRGTDLEANDSTYESGLQSTRSPRE